MGSESKGARAVAAAQPGQVPPAASPEASAGQNEQDAPTGSVTRASTGRRYRDDSVGGLGITTTGIADPMMTSWRVLPKTAFPAGLRRRL